MAKNEISYCLSADGNIFSFPAHLSVGCKNGDFMFCGTLQWKGKTLSEILSKMGIYLSEDAGSALDSLLSGCLPEQLSVLYQKDRLLISTDKTIQKQKVPEGMREYKFLVGGIMRFSGNNILCQGIRTIFGVQETTFFVGAAGDNVSCILTLPRIQTDIIESNNLYMKMQIGKPVQFIVQGTFRFPFLKGISFAMDCGVSETAFHLEALAEVKNPVKLFGPISIGNTCLMIQIGRELEMGLYSTLFLKDFHFFGAVMLKVSGSQVHPTILSAAIDDISLPELLDKLLPEKISGMDALNFIRISGLPFQDMPAFQAEQLNENDAPAIISQFNANIKSPSLQLKEIRLTPYDNGTDMTDLKRMRHYFINSEGKLQLKAQFYFADENTRLGEFTVERGLFICGVIETFQKEFEVLFSFRQSEGILAYAKIPSIDMKFLKITSSSFKNADNSSLPIAANSVLAQFINPSQEGVIFFLSATQKEVSFYLDGKVELFGLFCVDARILYMNQNICIDLHTKWFGILQFSLHLVVDYGKFNSGAFDFELKIDTSGLTEKLNSVTKKLETTVQNLRDKINNANQEISRAQAHVYELRNQISYYDGKIADCRDAIRHAKWWKRAFVAIAKGIEIGAYEIAKAGIYAAIGVATAALEVARGVLNMTGKIGESLLKAVNGVIKGAMSLFYINYITLKANASTAEQNFQAEIDFVVFGKKFHVSKQISTKSLTEDPAEAFSGAINEKIEPDLNNIENGSFRSNWEKYGFENYTLEEHREHLDEAKVHLNASVQMIQSMQNIYVDRLLTPMEEFDEMNVSLLQALDHVENTLQTGATAGNVAALGNAMGGLKRSVAHREAKGEFRDKELTRTKALIEKYDEARLLHDKVLDGIEHVQKCRKSLMSHSDRMHQKTREGELVSNKTSPNLGLVITDVEEAMYKTFPVTGNGELFINPSRETVIQKHFARTEELLGVQPDRSVQDMRMRSTKGNYKNRLIEEGDDY